jgi:hypothetical protein
MAHAQHQRYVRAEIYCATHVARSSPALATLITALARDVQSSRTRAYYDYIILITALARTL